MFLCSSSSSCCWFHSILPCPPLPMLWYISGCALHSQDSLLPLCFHTFMPAVAVKPPLPCFHSLYPKTVFLLSQLLCRSCPDTSPSCRLKTLSSSFCSFHISLFYSCLTLLLQSALKSNSKYLSKDLKTWILFKQLLVMYFAFLSNTGNAISHIKGKCQVGISVFHS